MKIAVSIPDDLFLNAEQVTKHLGLSRSELYRRALAAFLRQHDEQAVTEALNEVYGPDPDAGRLDPVLERMQIANVSHERW